MLRDNNKSERCSTLVFGEGKNSYCITLGEGDVRFCRVGCDLTPQEATDLALQPVC